METNYQDAITKNEKEYNDKLEELKSMYNENRSENEKKYLTKIESLQSKLKDTEEK
jgi:hypothetical protein